MYILGQVRFAISIYYAYIFYIFRIYANFLKILSNCFLFWSLNKLNSCSLCLLQQIILLIINIPKWWILKDFKYKCPRYNSNSPESMAAYCRGQFCMKMPSSNLELNIIAEQWVLVHRNILNCPNNCLRTLIFWS